MKESKDYINGDSLLLDHFESDAIMYTHLQKMFHKLVSFYDRNYCSAMRTANLCNLIKEMEVIIHDSLRGLISSHIKHS